jgi:hypothetical protein
VRRATIVVSFLVSLISVGCASHSPVPRSPGDAALFAPQSMRIHPIFTQIKDWTGDGKPDGVEALLEFQDQFSDPTKASGTVIFELYTYRKGDADPRGDRVVNPWVGSLQTLADQQARWNRTSRTYFFQLEYPAIRDDRTYVLAATFDTGANRFFDQIVIKGENAPRERAAPATRSTTRPSMTATTNATITGAATATTQPALMTPPPLPPLPPPLPATQSVSPSPSTRSVPDVSPAF